MKLIRTQCDEYATFGILLNDDGVRDAYTLELPWRDNQRNISCVPVGVYTAERYFSPHHQCTVFRLIDVPNRDDVELHVGNLPCDSAGCILLGSSMGKVYANGQERGYGVLGSRAAFLAFMANHPEQRFTLHITQLNP